MIEERRCSYEVCKLLHEKGFDVKCTDWYWENNINIWKPTHQMAIDWLGEKGIYITIVYGDYPALNKVFWTPQINSLKGFNLPDDFYKDYDKYGEACEAALKYALENLI